MISAILFCATIHIWDGDSFTCDGTLMRLLGGGIVNERGIDAPEIGSHAKCLKERKLALLAKKRLRELVEGEEIRIEVEGVDAFKRPLVNVYRARDGAEVGQVLMMEGFAREWRRGKRNDWCK